MPKTGSWITVVAVSAGIVAGIASLSRAPREMDAGTLASDPAAAQAADYAAWRDEGAEFREDIRRQRQESEPDRVASARPR